MTLLYIWLDNYGSFKKQGFQLHNKFHFHYDSDRGKLDIERNQYYISNFFEIQNIVDREDNGRVCSVTGIIGRNGAGKTTLLDFIKAQLVYDSSILRDKAIVVYQTKNDSIIFHHEDIRIDSGNYMDFGFRLTKYTKGDYSLANALDHKRIHSKISYIFFSNIFDAKREIQSNNLKNISTNFLVKQDKLDALQLRIHEPNFSETEIFRLSEIERQLKFINDYNTEELNLPIELPSQVWVSVNRIYSSETFHDNKKNKNVLKKRVLSFRLKMKTIFLDRSINIGGSEKVKIVFFHALIDSFLYDLASYEEDLIPVSFPSENLIESQSNWRSSVKRIMKEIKFVFSRENINYVDINRRIDGVQEMLDFFENQIDESNIDDDRLTFFLGNGVKTEKSINILIEKYKKASGFTPFLNFDWRGLSSGEKAMLSTYARFFRLSDEQERYHNLKLNDQVIVLIDEGELYLHPEWQKRFLLSVVNFLPTIYKGRTIQVIITSNSPIIVSDLPASNLIFIDKTEKGSKVIDGLLDNKQTFAANIHTLMSDAFFMSTGLIGDFARYKVNLLINQIMNRSSDDLWEDKDILEKSINIIGEPVLRNKIRHMLQEKLTNQYKNDEENKKLYDLVRKLQNDLEELKRERKHD
ncbi:AAA family ATPase [Paenibacillus xylanexedens]|uniref:AAA family ATPase n=1 Tax=Paenibacillus xylanexedens TaxID=528191 RepID=UPI00119D8E5F|nr:AAA family ATPase [Paenibacillus xylanexedens]